MVHEATVASEPHSTAGGNCAVLLCAGLWPRTAFDRRSPGSTRAWRPSVGRFGGVGRPAPNMPYVWIAATHLTDLRVSRA